MKECRWLINSENKSIPIISPVEKRIRHELCFVKILEGKMKEIISPACHLINRKLKRNWINLSAISGKCMQKMLEWSQKRMFTV
jgi:hypothetical protein